MRRPNEDVAAAVEARRPLLHDLQRDIADSAAKRKVIVVGRRAGKTTLLADQAVAGMLAGKRVLYAGPTSEQTDAFWEAVLSYLQPAIDRKAVTLNKTRRVLIWKSTGGRIKAKTAWNADTLRGDYADVLMLDEFALMDPSAWSEVGAPMLIDNNGDAWFSFTPKRKNHAYHMYVKALQDDTGRRRAWNAPSTVNPYISEEGLAEISTDMTSDAHRQEIGAEFLDSEGQVFRVPEFVLVEADDQGWYWTCSDKPEDHRGHFVVAGVDWAKRHDYHATSVLCVTCARELELHRYTGKDYTLQRQRVADMVKRWGVSELHVEANSIGEPNIELLQRGEKTDDGEYPPLPVRPFDMTPSSKPPLIEGLVLTLERKQVKWLSVPVATTELESYEGKASPRTGYMSYSAPKGLHDDTVVARAIARRAAGHRLGASSGISVQPAWQTR